jgi:hypothetical protein
MAQTEVEVIQTVDSALSGLDPAARLRVLRWACQKYGAQGNLPEEAGESPAPRKKRQKGRAVGKGESKVSSGKSRPSIVKDLNLRPKDKKDFPTFVSEKKPDGNYEKCTVAVYYLKQELGMATVGVDHVFTCFKAVNWRLPADLENTLALTSHRKGWLDTSNFDDIKITVHGENLVEHDLPARAEK